MEKKKENKKQKKRSYTPPIIEKIDLDTEVMLTTNCKITGGSTKAGWICTQGGARCKDRTAGS